MENFSKFRKAMNKVATDYFREKGYEVQTKYPFILKNYNDWKKNIILPENAGYIETVKKNCENEHIPFPLHKYIHHGLSSQALLFNLLTSFVLHNDVKALQHIFSEDATLIDEQSILQFEFYNRDVFKENKPQPTSFDFAIRNINKKSIYIESKFVETNFGGCSVIENGNCDGQNPINNHDMCYLHRIGRKYWTLMNEYHADKIYKEDHICPLAIYYQFYREVLFAKKENGIFYLLYDKRNPAFINSSGRGLFTLLYSRLPDELKEITKAMSIQTIVQRLEEMDLEWLEEFKKKYGIKDQV